MSVPDYLTDLAKRIWKETSICFPDLEKEDPTLLTSYSQASAMVEEMQTQINRDGLVVPNSRGNPSCHPLLNPMKGWVREKINLSNMIRKNHSTAEEAQDLFA
ncbi:hypothetical protein LCGC14_2506850 [marine sediment metagenome]|uniref:Uncharacterized protein n=1 Tax=marine sediment metagenome TaxID=412755 RepID=A0A0F9DC36_9ZZZZ